MKTETCNSIQGVKDYFVFSIGEEARDGSPLTVRISKNIAEELLLNNVGIIKDGCVRYFQIKNIGFSVHEIRLRPKGKINTYLNKDWEKIN